MAEFDRRPTLEKIVVIFDAVGTLIHPFPDVIEVYHRAGREFGSMLSRLDVKARFHRARQKHFLVDVPDGQKFDGELSSSDPIERVLWQRLVQDMFPDVADTTALLDHLWHHFQQPDNWGVYEDVAPCWAELRQHGCSIGIGSNFDSRLLEICTHHAPIHTADWVFYSAAIGFRKPDLAFYRGVQHEVVGNPGREGETEFWMVGDNFKNDVVAASNFGWNSCWLVRRGAPAERNISSLRQLPALLQENPPR